MAKLPVDPKTGRFVTVFDPAVMLEICELIAQGDRSLKEILESKPGYPAKATFYRWTVNNSEAQRAFVAARELSAYSLEEEALDMARAIRLLPENSVKVSAYKVAIDQLRWSAERRNSRDFGAKAATSITVPITIISPLDLSAGPAKDEALENIFKIEAKVAVPVPTEMPEEFPEENTRMKPEVGGRPPGARNKGKVQLKPRMAPEAWAKKRSGK